MGTIRIQSTSTEKNFAGLVAWYALQHPQWQPKPEDDITFVRHCFATIAQRSVCAVMEVGYGTPRIWMTGHGRGFAPDVYD